MKATVFKEVGGPDRLQVETRPDPTFGPADALVRVRACGVNRVDLLVRRGTAGARISMPHIGGCEIAGEVVQLGLSANTDALPDGVTYLAAAAVSLATITAWHMLVTQANLRPGEDVLVLAAGSGVGSTAIQIARLIGARVIATASTPEKRERA